MSVAEIETFVIDSLGRFLSSLDRDVPRIKGNTDPIKDLGLDSADGVDWVCDVEGRGFNVPKDVNPFVLGKGPCTRTVRQIAELLQNCQTSAPEANTNE